MMIAAGEGESAGDEMGNEELSDDNLSLFSHSAAEAEDSKHADRGNAGAPIDDAPFLAEVFCNKVADNHDVQLMGIATAAQQLVQWLDDSRSYCDHLEWGHSQEMSNIIDEKDQEIGALQKILDQERLSFGCVQREYDELRYMYPSSQTEMFDQLMGRIETLEKRLATKDSVELDLFRAHDEVRD